jgi:hypothetical protein
MRFLLAGFLALTLHGCAPIIAGSLIQASATNNAKHSAFVNSFNQVNATRQAAGLIPLDFCSEAYWHDKGWARKRDECAGRVMQYEAGLTAALNPPDIARSQSEMDSLVRGQRAYLDSLSRAKAEEKKRR